MPSHTTHTPTNNTRPHKTKRKMHTLTTARTANARQITVRACKDRKHAGRIFMLAGNTGYVLTFDEIKDLANNIVDLMETLDAQRQ